MERLCSNMVEQKLDLLVSNLNKKFVILKEMADVLDTQLQLLNTSDIQMEELDMCMEKQGSLTEKLESLNEEADFLYEYLQKADISVGADDVSKIAHIKELLVQIATDFDNLQEKEQSARRRMDAFFQKERKNFRDGRRSSKAAFDYYKSMSGANVVPPQFMDWKK